MNERGNVLRHPLRMLCSGTVATGAFLLRTLRLIVFSVMALLEPVILWLLTALTVILFLLAAFYGLVQLAHPTHFPFAVILGLIAGCGVLGIAYYAFMFLLLPSTEGSSRLR
jgi:hypothetical protein